MYYKQNNNTGQISSIHKAGFKGFACSVPIPKIKKDFKIIGS